MLTSYSLVKHFKLRLLCIFVSALIINCYEINNLFEVKEENICPFIETLSFWSDIDIKCNSTYLIFNEINNMRLNWKFANQSSFCHQKGKQQAFVNQCNITQINSKYLTVPLKSLTTNEGACIYCPINYKPIAPMIIVTRSNDAYTFNLTATGLDHNESFEILWAKRASQRVQISFNYWFLQKCIYPDIYIDSKDITGHSIIFTTNDIFISRVEFIIRRCNGSCRSYEQCSEDEFNKEVPLNHFQIPDSIEKISCDYDCLNGILSTTTTTTTTTTTVNTIQSSSEKPTIKLLIFFPILGFLIVLLFVILGCFIIPKIKGSRTENVYTKTSNTNLDENKENVES